LAVVVLRSNGENEARVYATVDVPPRGVAPGVEEKERVQIVDPRQTATVRRSARRAGAGPRNPQAKTLPPAETTPPAVELPDARPPTKAQRVILDPAVVARWRAQAREEEAAAKKKEGP
jgi:hypothetical protein